MGSLGPAAKSTAAYLDLHKPQFATFIQRDAPAGSARFLAIMETVCRYEPSPCRRW